MAHFRSFVSDLIEFKPTERPKWRIGKDDVPLVKDMIMEIVRYQQEWRNNVKIYNNAREIKKKYRHSFIFHCNVEEGHGCGTLEETKNCLDEDNKDEKRFSMSKKEQETFNLDKAYQYLLDIKKEESDEEFHGFIEESMLRETNKIILEGIKLHEVATKPGVYSNKLRITEFHSETYQYQNPKDMHVAVVERLDKFNSLYADAQSESEDEKKLEKLFKACSWFVFEMLDLHPFGDGNGRLCRLLCSYVLSTCSPFPSPIYNVFSTSCKDDYKQALVDARKSKDRHPCSLTTMIIECNFYAWKEFMKEVQLYSLSKSTVADNPTSDEATTEVAVNVTKT